MMLSSHFASKVINIIVGKTGRKLNAHTAFLCKSDKLKALTEGGWADKEAIVLPDWDEETVGRLLEWLYTGTYSFPCPQALQSDDAKNTSSASPKAETSSSGPSYNETSFLPTSMVNPKDSDGTAEAFTKFAAVNSLDELQAVYHYPSRLQSGHFSIWKRRSVGHPNFAKHQISYFETLIAHARLYVLSNYMLLPELQQLAFHNLRDVVFFLRELPAGCPVITDVVTLTQYVYANTASLKNSEEPLRFFLSSYIAINATAWKEGAFDTLMEEGGDIAIDISRKVRQRLEHVEEKLKKSLKRKGTSKKETPAKKPRNQPVA